MEKLKQLYSGKAKTLYTTADKDFLIVDFRDDTSAFDGVKKAKLSRKGMVNNYFNAFIMQQLEKAGIPTHFVKLFSENESIVKHLDMIKVECVVRNIAAGSLCRRLGVQEGLEFDPPLFEFFLKNDELHDPMINDNHILTFGWAKQEEINKMKELTLKVNQVLKPLFRKVGMLLVDYKLEFGRYKDEIVLGDEFTPDGCRIWDVETRKSLDKDRFRKDMGDVIEGYEEAAHRLGVKIPAEA